MSKEKKTVFILCGIIGFILLGSVCVIVYMQKDWSGVHYARIYQDDKLIEEIDLDRVEETYTLTVKGTEGQENVIEVRRGEIGIVSATCPDSLCVQMGFIHTAAYPVTCLPNRVVIEITDSAEEMGQWDAVAY